MALTHFVTGGVRSGKSRFVLDEAERLRGGGTVGFIATARPIDADMAARIARHREERGPAYTTIEAPLALAAALRNEASRHAVLVVDCLTVWAANVMFDGERSPDDDTLHALFDDLAATVRSATTPVLLVSNEVGLATHPEHAVSRRYVDLLGRLNQRIAAACTTATLLVAGLPVPLKRPVAVRRAPGSPGCLED